MRTQTQLLEQFQIDKNIEGYSYDTLCVQQGALKEQILDEMHSYNKRSSYIMLI